MKKASHGLALLHLERVMGIEPTYQAWEAGVLPLNYTRSESPRLSRAKASIINDFACALRGSCRSQPPHTENLTAPTQLALGPSDSGQ